VQSLGSEASGDVLKIALEPAEPDDDLEDDLPTSD